MGKYGKKWKVRGGCVIEIKRRLRRNAMVLKTRIFELRNGYRNLSELAKAMGISVSQIYRVRDGKRKINQKFIIGAISAFPDSKLDELFYLAPGK